MTYEPVNGKRQPPDACGAGDAQGAAEGRSTRGDGVLRGRGGAEGRGRLQAAPCRTEKTLKKVLQYRLFFPRYFIYK